MTFRLLKSTKGCSCRSHFAMNATIWESQESNGYAESCAVNAEQHRNIRGYPFGAPLSTEVVPQTAWRGLQILVAYYELRDCDADMDSDLPVIGHWGYWHIKDLAEERFKNRRRTKR